MNLHTNESGLVWCAKLNSDVRPDLSNLSGCSHCVYCSKLHQSKSMQITGVTCRLVPNIKFCERQAVNDDGSRLCLVETDLDEYKSLTGHVDAKSVPEEFIIPRPTTFTKCLLCFSTGRTICKAIPGKSKEVINACQSLSSPKIQSQYPPPVSEGGRAMRSILKKLNPSWSSVSNELEDRGESPFNPNEPDTGNGMERSK